MVVELLYKIKKKILKAYHDYFTIDGKYTSLLPDKVYLRKLYKCRMDKCINFNCPRTYNEKLQWLKLYDRKPEYTTMVDKYAVRDYIRHKVEREGTTCSELGLYFIPIIGVWEKAEEIDFESLPNQFVLKCNHDNGVIICKDKGKINIDATKMQLQSRLDRNYYKKNREWPYKNVKRKVICEKLMQGKNQIDLIDYKFFCFDGKVKCVLIVTGRFNDIREDYFDSDFVHLPLKKGGLNATGAINPPNNFEKMKTIAEIISKGLIHLRVDFYEINNKIYFGELTFFDGGGFEKFNPEKWDFVFGEWIHLPIEKCKDEQMEEKHGRTAMDNNCQRRH